VSAERPPGFDEMSQERQRRWRVENVDDWQFCCRTCGAAMNSAGTQHEREYIEGLAFAHLDHGELDEDGEQVQECEEVDIHDWDGEAWSRVSTIDRSQL